MTLDRTDRQILRLLQSDSSISNQDLADRVSLSPSPCLRRVKHLYDKGYIRKQVALLDATTLGLNLTIILSVGLKSHTRKTMSKFEEEIKKVDEVIQCFMIAGQSADYLLKIVARDMNHYQQLLLEKITHIDEVHSFHSSFVMQTVIDKNELPLDHA